MEDGGWRMVSTHTVATYLLLTVRLRTVNSCCNYTQSPSYSAYSRGYKKQARQGGIGIGIDIGIDTARSTSVRSITLHH